MNRPLLLALLALSLAGNAALGLYATRAPASGSSAPAATTPAAAAATKSAGPANPAAFSAKLAAQVAAARTPEDFKSLTESLRAAGLPDSVISIVMQSIIGQEFSRRRRAIFDYASVPYWKNLNQTPEQRRATRALDKEMRDTIASLGFPPHPEIAAFRHRQYGDMPETKIAAIERIQQDYSDMRQEIYEAQRGGAVRGQDLGAQIRLLEEEQRNDIAALLTPQEQLEYELRTSNASSQLRGALREVDVNEQEFRELYAAQKAYEAVEQASRGRPPTLDERTAGLASWEQLQSQARGTLGDERYRQYLLSSQLNNPNARAFFNERPALTVDQMQAVARLVRSLPIEMQRETSAPGLSGADRGARVTALVDRARSQAIQILGPQHGQELLNQNLLPLPRTAPGNGGIQQGVRLPIPGGG